MKKCLLIQLSLFALLTQSGEAASQTSSSDEETIREQARTFKKAFASGDAPAIARLWSDDGVLVDEDGIEYKGRQSILKVYQDFFQRKGGQELNLVIESIRFPTPDVAVETGYAELAQAASGANPRSRYTALHVRKDGKWLMDQVTETGFTAKSGSEYLKDLDWLVGTWNAGSGADLVKLSVNWGLNKNFLVLEFRDAKNTPGMTEYIGWNPMTERISSWHFNKDGGFGSGIWLKDRGRWIVNADSVQPDGAPGGATYLLSPGDGDSFTWRSMKRWLGKERLSDTAAIKVTRVKE